MDIYTIEEVIKHHDDGDFPLEGDIIKSNGNEYIFIKTEELPVVMMKLLVMHDHDLPNGERVYADNIVVYVDGSFHGPAILSVMKDFIG